jgi:hypothetical protein
MHASIGRQSARMSVESACRMDCAFPECIQLRTEIPILVAVRYKAAWLLGSRVQIPLNACSLVFVVCCVSSSSATSWSLVQRNPTAPRARLCGCVSVCDLETSTVRRLRPEFGSGVTKKFWNRRLKSHCFNSLTYYYTLLIKFETNWFLVVEMK